ncbi:MAG: hypothetical protein IIA59_02260 [Candidatus Marinimicrobia bacterium]|nr:hypothetical protein [Candidatus Neomarinimicrobiota bacterium]
MKITMSGLIYVPIFPLRDARFNPKPNPTVAARVPIEKRIGVSSVNDAPDQIDIVISMRTEMNSDATMSAADRDFPRGAT